MLRAVRRALAGRVPRHRRRTLFMRGTETFGLRHAGGWFGQAAQRVRHSFPQGLPLPDDVWRRRHRSIIVLLWLHVIGLACFGIFAQYGVIHSLSEAALVAIAAL